MKSLRGLTGSLAMLLVVLFGGRSAGAGEGLLTYVGTYTGAKSKGIYAFDFNAATGKAGEPRLVVETPSPSFLALHPNGKVLYAVNEVNELNGEKGGGLSAFKIEADGKLTLLNQASTVGSGPCHLTIDSKGRAVLAANYGGGSVVSYRLEADGRLGKRASFIQHTGSSVDKQRQEGPHAHGIYLDATDRFAYVPDLGLDKVLIYRFDGATGELKPHDPAAGVLSPGSGPRHFALHPAKPLAWSLNEMLSTITTLHVIKPNGGLMPGGTISTLPVGFTGVSSTAEIFVHPGGRFLYASNRGHDSIALFVINPSDGSLTPIEQVPIGGKTPRSFALDPSGKWLLAAGQDSDSISIFAITAATGRLTATGEKINAPTPVCLVFLKR
jgi:6-phosphogluconolactonase